MADCQIVQAACSNDRQEAFEQEATEETENGVAESAPFDV
jgi:hypothetical protein